jgi:predicted neuraminidase
VKFTPCFRLDFINEKNLTLSIYDNSGKLIQQKTLEMKDGNIKLNLEQEAKGIYNVVLSNKKKSYNGKIVFE